MDKRTRGPKYDESHLVVLSNLVIKYKDIIENKKSDQNIWKTKDVTWNKIQSEFNALTGIVRPAKSLKERYEKLKKDSKKVLASEKREIFRTGGGICKKIPRSEAIDKIISLLGISGEGLNNPYDDDDIDNIGIVEENFEENEIQNTTTFTDNEINNMETFIVNENINNIIPTNVVNEENIIILNSSVIETKNQTDVAQNEFSSNIISTEDWKSWSPAQLKTPVSSKLKQVRCVNDSSQPQKKKKYENLKDEVRQKTIDLIMIKTQLAKEELAYFLKKKENDEKLFEIEIEKKKLEILKLKSEIKSDDIV